MDAFDELVKRGRQRTEFVNAMYAKATREITFTGGDVMHGAAHNVQRDHQDTDQ
ncbi:hypothetical protein D3C76_1678360 [compost metagenome]